MIMKTVDWDSYLFRCSSLGKLMPGPKAKSGVLQQTTITELDKIWLNEVYDYYEDISSKEMEKGVIVEPDAAKLIGKLFYPGEFIEVNKKRYSNEFISGCPDLPMFKHNINRDIKCPWDLRTFKNATQIFIQAGRSIHDYAWQGIGYMWLLGFDTHIVDYCLMDTPEHLIYDAVNRATFYQGVNDSDPRYDKIERQIRLNLSEYDRIPDEKRVKSYTINRNSKFEEMIMENVPLWREYLKNNSL